MSYSINDELEVSNIDLYLNDALKFKGINNENRQIQKYYDCGAHFSYKDICKVLESVVMNLSAERRGISMYEDNNFELFNSYSETKKLKTNYEKVILL